MGFNTAWKNRPYSAVLTDIRCCLRRMENS